MAAKSTEKPVLFLRGPKTLGLGLLFLSALLVSVVLSFSKPAIAATNSTLNFQARLQTASGSQVPDGYYNVQFKLYDVSSGGSALWTESHYDSNGVTAGNDNRVRVKNGYLTVTLGSQTAFPSTINWDQDLWITMNIGGLAQTATPTYDGEMSPRLKLTGVPYAFRAGQLAKFGGTYTSTLELASPTVGNQTFTIPDQGAAGSYTLLTTNTANANFIQNTNTPQTANFSITGNGVIGGTLTTGPVNNTVINKQYVHTSDSSVHNYKIATLPLSTASTYDHMRILATLNRNWGAASNTNIDATFANRNAFTYRYDLMGAPAHPAVSIKAYDNSGAVDIYLSFDGTQGTFTNATYSIIESQYVTVYANPVDAGASPTGSLVFDSSSSSYPPNSYTATNGDMTANGSALFKSVTNSTTAFQVQDAAGNKMLGVGTGSTNYITNHGFEVDTTGWALSGASTITRHTSAANVYHGSASLQIATTAAANDGARVSTFTASPTFATSATWALSFFAKSSSTITSNLQFGYNIGAGDVTCSTTGSVSTSGFNRYTCTITLTSGQTISSIFVRQGDATARNIWIDGVQLIPGSNQTPYQPGTLQLNGVIDSPVILRAASNSTTAFQVQNSAGTGNTFTIDTLNNRASINTGGYSATLNVGGTQINRTTTNSASAFQIQNSNQTPILGVNTVTPAANLISNPGFEQNTTNWAAKNGGAITRVTTAAALYYGVAAGQVVTGTSAGGGTAFTVGTTLSTTYNLSFYARASSGTATGISFGYTNTGGDVDCATGQSIPSTGFTRFSCSFTVTTTAGTAIYLKQSGTTSQTIYIDGFQLLGAGATSATPYGLGSIQLRGVIDTPLALQNNVDSTTAFQIQNSAGTSNLFVADTLNGRVGIGTSAPRGNLDLGVDGATLVIGGYTNGGHIKFGSNLSADSIDYENSEFGFRTDQANGFRFYTDAGTDAVNPEFVIDNSGNILQNGTGTFTTGTGNVALNGNVTVASGKTLTVNDELYVVGNLRLTDRTREFTSAYSTTIAASTPIQMGEFTFTANSQNVLLSGEIRGQSGGGIGINRFYIAARSDTLPSKSFTFGYDKSGSLDIDAKLYHDATTGRVVLAYQSGATPPQNVTWSVTSNDRDLYDFYTHTTSYSVLNTTGLTEITPGGTYTRTLTGNLTTNGALTANGGGSLTGGTVNINNGSNNATNINTGASNGLVSIGGGSGTFALNTTNIDISNTGAITGATGITMASGNFVQTGTGTFATGTGAVSLNGNVTLASGMTLTASGNITTTTDVLGRAVTSSGYLTSSTSNTFNGQYTKLASCTITAQYQDCRTLAQVLAYADGNGTAYRATVDWRVKQQNAMAGVPAIDLEISNLNTLQSNDFTAVTVQNDATATVVELWGQIDTTYTIWSVNPTVNTSTKAVWLAAQGFSASLPAGTQTAATYADERLATLTTTGNVTVGATINITTNLQTGGTTRLDNAGALSNITGYSQSSGNFVQSGAGTFATGTGAVSLNGDVTVASGKTLTVNGNSTITGNLQLNGNLNDGQGFARNITTNEWSWHGRQYTGNQGAVSLNLFTHFLDVTETPLQTRYVHTNTLASNGQIAGTNFTTTSTYHAIWTTYIHVNQNFSLTNVNLTGDDAHSLYINNKFVAGATVCCGNSTYSYSFKPGWYKIDMIYNQGGGGHYVQLGWNPKDYTAYIDAMTPFGPSDMYNTEQIAFREGNVGFGTTTPGYKVDVQGGDINTGGNLRTGGTVRLDNAGALSNISGYNQTTGNFQATVGPSYLDASWFTFSAVNDGRTTFSTSRNNWKNLVIYNPGFEGYTTHWNLKNAGTGLALSHYGLPGYSDPSSVVANVYDGHYSLQVVTASGTANTGVFYQDFNPAVTASTQYTLSFYAKASGSNFSTLRVGMAYDGSTDTVCSLNSTTVTTTGWNRYSCTFTTAGSVASPHIFFTVSDTTTHTFYIDNVMLQTGSTVQPFDTGYLKFEGTITNPVSFQSSSNSTTAFQIQNAAGTSNAFVVDTLNGRIGSGIVGQAASFAIQTGGALTDTALLVKQANSQTGLLLDVQASSGTSFLNVNQYGALAVNGSATFQNGADSTTAFAVKNSSGAGGTTLLGVDTTNKIVNTEADVNIGSASGRPGANRLFSDSFESGNEKLWSGGATIGGSSTITGETSIVRNGRYSTKFTNNNGTAFLSTGLAAASTASVRAYVYIGSHTTGAADLLTLNAGSNYFTAFRDLGTGQLRFWNSVTGTSSPGSTVMTTGAWHQVELLVSSINATTGSATVYLDGVAVVTLSNINTGSTSINSLVIGDTNSGRAHTVYIDDVAVDYWRPGEAASLGVNDSLHVAGTSSFGGNVLFQAGSNATNAFSIQNSAGTVNLFNVDTSANAVTIGANTAVIGNVEVKDAATATKAYRLRTSGGALDFEAGGASLYLSSWSNANYTGTQYNYLVLDNTQHVASVLGSWQFKQAVGGTVRHIIDGTAGTSVQFNQDGAATDFRIQGDTAGYLFYTQGSSDRVGINNSNPGYTLDVGGTINGTAYRVGGTAGSSTTCTGGQIIQNAVVAGGIITGGTCTSNAAGVTTLGAILTTGKGANGGVITGSTLQMQEADASFAGLVSTGSQTFGGAKTFNGVTTLADRVTLSGTITTGSSSRMNLTGTLNSSGTSSQYGLQNALNFTPTGASLSNIYGTASDVTVAGSALNIGKVVGVTASIATTSGYTGLISTGIGLEIGAPSVAGSQLISDYRGIFVNGFSGNGGNTSGTINNHQLRFNGITAAAGSGGTVNNYGIYVTQPSGAGGTATNNYGIYITGAGGGTTNYALYNTGTAPIYTQGNLQVGTTSNPNGYALQVAGDINSTTGSYRTGNTERLNNAGALTNITGYTQTSGTASITTTSASAFQVTTSNTSLTLPMAKLEQTSTGDATLELKNTSASFYLGQDTSSANAFVLNSSTAARPLTGQTPGTPAHVQTAAGTGTGGSPSVSSQTATFASNNTAGNLIVVTFSMDSNNSWDASCSDSAGNSYSGTILREDTTGNQNVGVCYATNIVGGANTVTVLFDYKATFTDITISEYSGVATVNPLDVYSTNFTTSTTATDNVTSGSATTTQNNDLIFGVVAHTNSCACTTSVGTGFTSRYASGTGHYRVEDKILATAGSTAATFTFGQAHRYVAIMLAFKAAMTGGSQSSLTDTYSNPIFKLSQTGSLQLQNSTDSSSALVVKNAAGTKTALRVDTGTGSVGIGGNGNNTPTRTLDVNGSFGGNQFSDVRDVTTDSTIQVTTPALVYNFQTDQNTTNASVTTTYNITGVPNIDGTVIMVSMLSEKGISSGSQDNSIDVDIHGQHVAWIETCTNTSACSWYQALTLARIGGAWKVVGAGPEDDYDFDSLTSGFDLAEWIPFAGDKPQPGELLAIGDTAGAVSAKKTTGRYDTTMIGVVTTDPGLVLGGDDGKSVRMALTGRVPVKVNLENGPIQPGDYLTSSSTPGVAMKATQAGKVIGTAFTAYDGSQPEATVMTQVQAGYAVPDGGSVNSLQGGSMSGTGVAAPEEGSDSDTATETDAKISKLQGEVAGIQGDMAGLQSQINGYGTSINTLALTAGSMDVSGDATIGGNLEVKGLVKIVSIEISGHIISKGEAPKVELLGAAGNVDEQDIYDDATVTITGNDTAGVLTVTIGQAPQTDQLLKVVFNKAFGAAPQVLLTPVGSDSAKLQAYVDSPTTNDFILGLIGTPETGKTYRFNYYVIQ